MSDAWCYAGAQVNEFVKRVRAARIHMLILGHLRKQMPALMGKRAAQERLLKNLPNEFAQVQREFHLPPGVLSAITQFVVPTGSAVPRHFLTCQ